MTAELPDGATTWVQDGRTFVRFPDDMYIYEREEDGRLPRVALEDLPPRLPNPDMDRLDREIRPSTARL